MTRFVFLLAFLTPNLIAADKPGITLDYLTHSVESRDKDGKLLWSVPLKKSLAMHRDPHFLSDAERVYVSHAFGVSALDRKTGRVLWFSEGPHDRMLLSGKLLLAAECASDSDPRWFQARDVRTGKEVFRTQLPASDFDPMPIREIGGLFLVQTHESPGGKGNGLLIDQAGQVWHRFSRYVTAGINQGQDRVFLTSKEIICLTPDRKARWTIQLEEKWPAGGGLVAVADGDVIAFLHGIISDSGVEVARIKPATGKVVWKVECKPLGVGHSKYHHEARVEIQDKQLKVTSKGSAGTFIELLDLATGKQLERKRMR
jgi:outer membrane protein assembly factor BamB